MSGFGNHTLNELVAIAVLEQIKTTLLMCSKAMIAEACSTAQFIDNDEEKIRNRLFARYLNNDDFLKEKKIDLHLMFSIEAPENFNTETDMYEGRVDIKVVNTNIFQTDKIYYTIECKRINGQADLNRKYVSEGISRYVCEPIKYSSKLNRNLMLGFVVKEIDVENNCVKINYLQNQMLQSYILSQMEKTDFESPNYYFYLSRYKHSIEKSIELHHMFFNFSPMIRSSPNQV